MSHHVHRTFTCMDYSKGFAADISALALSLEENVANNDFTDHLVTARGMNGLVVVSLLPHGGSLGRGWDKAWTIVKVQLKEIAVRHQAEWMELSFGGDHEGSPYLETNHHKLGARGVMISKVQADIDPQE